MKKLTSLKENQIVNFFDNKLIPFTNFLPERIISWKSYWALIPVSVLSTLIFIAPSIATKSQLLTWLAISLFGHAAMAPFVFHFNGKYDRKVHLVFGLVMGAARGATINLTAPVLLVQDPLPLVLRVINSAISVLYALIISSLLIAIWSKFDAELRQLLSSAMGFSAQQETRIDSTQYLSAPKTSGQIQQVISDLRNRIESANSESGIPLTLKEQASAIDRLINKHIRPHSAERWRESELIWPKIRPWRVIREAFSATNLPVASTLIITTPLVFFGQITRSGFVKGILVQLVSLSSLMLLSRVSRTISKSNSNPIKASNTLFLLATFIAYLPSVITFSFFITGDSYDSLNNFIQVHVATVLTFLFLTLLASVVLTVQREREDALELLRSLISEREFQIMVEGGVAASTQSEYAQYLHAEVQSQLMACKLLLLKAAESEFTLFSPEVTQKVLDRLDLLKTPYEKRPDRIPVTRLREFQRTWQGLASMEFDLPSELSQPSRNGEIISQLIEELIVNAIRHGKAKNIFISARVTGGRCLVSVLDDGKLKSTKKMGLGSTLFEVFAPDWKLESTSQGTRATLSAKFY